MDEDSIEKLQSQLIQTLLQQTPAKCNKPEKTLLQPTSANSKRPENTLLQQTSANSSNKNEGLQVHGTRTRDESKKRFSCDKCPKSFKNNSALKEHIKTVHEGLKYECKTCNKTYFTKVGLKNCQAGHQGNKKHICGVCGESFVYKTSLQNHMFKHSQEWPTCKNCGRQFGAMSNLSRHIKTCGKDVEKTLQCSHCPKKFSTKEYLNQHEMCTHLKPKSYVCPICSFKYSHSASLRKHMKICAGSS